MLPNQIFKGRISRALLDFCKHRNAMTHPDGMLVRISREELERIVGRSRKMFCRILKDLEEDHLI